MKPNQSEDRHACEHETNFRMPKLQEPKREASPTENRFLKALHWMRCPKCGHKLITEHHGPVEIDVCRSCQGAWLGSLALETIVAAENDMTWTANLGGMVRHTELRPNSTPPTVSRGENHE